MSTTWRPSAEAAADPGGGDRRCGKARLLKAAEIGPKTSGSDAGGATADCGGGCSSWGDGVGGGVGGRGLRCGKCPRESIGDWGAHERRVGVAAPPCRWWGGRKDQLPARPIAVAPHSMSSPC